MEFKVNNLQSGINTIQVDIGTEWNLKTNCCGQFNGGGWVDIGTEWNLKSYAFPVMSARIAC